MSFSAAAWAHVAPLYQQIVAMPYLRELSDGTLPLAKFQFYLAQDAHYLGYFGRTLSFIAARLNDTDQALAFLRFAEGAIIVENALHESYFRSFGMQERGKIEPVCHHYIHFLRSTAALAPVEVAVAAVLPCFKVYLEVGKGIYAAQQTANPYKQWIDTYAGEAFAQLVTLASDICDSLAATASESRRAEMLQAYTQATKLEYWFWDAAYELKTWEQA